MPHISKRNLSLGHLEELQGELIKCFDRASANNKSRPVFNDFFTRTERVMLSKRLAVIAMLSRGVSSHMISEVLAMSPSTTERMSGQYQKGRYDHVIKNALGKKDIWDLIEKILSAEGVVPPIAGGKRWRMLDRVIRKEKLINS